MKDTIQLFKEHYGCDPMGIIRAPGRVNLIGEHTDYNDGFVLPAAIDRAIYLAISPRENSRVSIYSAEFNSSINFSLDDLQHGDGWGEYAKGVAWALMQKGYKLKGWQGVLVSDIPQGAGLSSSAAFEMAVACAFKISSGFEISLLEMALIGQKAENEWVGVRCGIMDQMISACGVRDHALLIDCRTLGCDGYNY
jgi:galactokinase